MPIVLLYNHECSIFGCFQLQVERHIIPIGTVASINEHLRWTVEMCERLQNSGAHPHVCHVPVSTGIIHVDELD